MVLSKNIICAMGLLATGIVGAAGGEGVCKECKATCAPDVVIPTDKKTCEFLSYTDPVKNFTMCVDLRHKPEFYYTKNVQRFSGNAADQTIYAQSTWDLITAIDYKDALQSKFSLRNKARWGNPQLIRTTVEDINIAGVSTGRHNHHIGRHIMWVREGWLQLSLNEVFGLPTNNRHYLKLGMFPFQLGRGISLGDAYSVSPGIVGFFTDDAVDQYAYGMLEHGELIPCILSYDFYYELMRNRSGSFFENSEQIYNQMLDLRTTPRRNFGSIDQLFAFRLNANVLNGDCGKLKAEPYILGAFSPEQRIEVSADSWTRLGTCGMAVNYSNKRVEFGSEMAFNFGSQHVRPLDRNAIEMFCNADGMVVERYTQVYNGDPAAGGSQALVTTSNKRIVNANIQSYVANGDKIIDGSNLYNGRTRYRPEYKNVLGGFMALAELGVMVINDDFRVAGSVAYASGDQDPNLNIDDQNASRVDGSYNGFIGIQELYKGELVQSVFVIGSNRISRPLSSPLSSVTPVRNFASNISGFTNLGVVGGGFHWMPKGSAKKVKIKPNLIGYWQTDPSNKFDITTGQTINEPANRFLGTELNLWAECKLLKGSLKLFGVVGVFVPGQHYKDIKGKPQTPSEARALSDDVRNGNPSPNTILVGDASAVAVNFGLEYAF